MDLELVSNIYSRLQDDISRDIFKNRLMYSISGNRKFITDMVLHTSYLFSWVLDFRHNLKQEYLSGKKLIIDGCGKYGGILQELFSDVEWYCYSDNNPNVDFIHGLQVLSRKEAVKLHDALFVISTPKFCDEIEEELRLYNVGHILNFGRIVKDNFEPKVFEGDKECFQYFDVFDYSSDEVFVDCGCFDCKSIRHFIEITKGKYNRIISFEAEKKTYEKCKSIIENNGWEKCEIENRCLWNSETELTMFYKELGGSSIVETTGTSLEITKTCMLDNYFSDKMSPPPTYIKMDIEGSEIMALEGGKQIIGKYKPKLGISIYHRKEDIIKIPKLILDFCPDYKFWLRHYTLSDVDTILYACL